MVRRARGLLTAVLHPARSLAAAPAPSRGPFRTGVFASRLHTERTAAILGIALGVAFGVCFLTGIASHLIQHPVGWFRWPASPAWLFRVTQGMHVATGIAAIPLLLAKLWTVYPRLWTWPPVEDLDHVLERASLVPLVGGSVFLLATGVLNVAYWYPFRFFFPAAHYAAAWITVGALVVHIGAKAAVTRRALSRRPAATATGPAGEGGLTRRGFLAAVGAGAGVLTLATVGGTVAPLRAVSVLAPRRPGVGPQGVPVNRTAGGARVAALATDPGYRLEVAGRVREPLRLSREELRAMPQATARLPIACVEGWSAVADWTGVPVRDLLARAGTAPGASVLVESLEPRGNYRTSLLDPAHAAHPDTLLAMLLNGEPLHLEHGYPVRLISPSNPGVMQTKWVARLVVS